MPDKMPARRTLLGDVAQWLEHLLCTQGSWVRVPSSPPLKPSSEGIRRIVRSRPNSVVRAACVITREYLAHGRSYFGSVRKLSSRRWQASYCKVTFGEYSLTWLQRQGHLRPRTRELYEFLLRKHIDPTFGPRSLTAIANSEVVAWYRGLGARVPGTAPKCFRLLRQFMAAAVADGYIVKSPVVIKVLRESTSRKRRSRRCPR